ncbi:MULTISPECIES: PmoA family protein [unclassified Microbacterium]|uniref:DUF6807 domain-containing protein n=1 Tax=unclassified Microbacterium TaxID=2609290 RepID=UPI003870D40D
MTEPTPSLQVGDTDVTVTVDGVELLRYVFVPDSPQLESPKPYLDPIRTRAGRVVSLYRPWDHVWHKGIAWSLPVVGDENFWGGPTFIRDEGYRQLPNNGTQGHLDVQEASVTDGVARFRHTLDWTTETGAQIFTEERALSARVLSDDSWALTVQIAMTNVSGAPIRIGSPTTKGRENAGYGGLFWRGPRSFTEGRLVTTDGEGSGNDVRGQRHEWMGFVGRHDVIDESSLIVMLDAAENPSHPPQWFARSEEFACLNPAPFFSEELEIAPADTVTFRYVVGVAGAGAAAAPALADALRPLR